MGSRCGEESWLRLQKERKKTSSSSSSNNNNNNNNKLNIKV